MKLFISHSSRDEAELATVKGWLAGQGHEVLLVARGKKQEQAPDDQLKAEVGHALVASDAVVLLVSPFFEASLLARHEEQAAREAAKPLIAVIVAPTTQHPSEGLRGRFDLTLDRKAGFAALGEELATLAAELSAARARPVGVATPKPARGSAPAAAPEAVPVEPAASEAPAVPAEAKAETSAPRASETTFEHRIRMSVDEARKRMHTNSLPDWLAWAVHAPVTRRPVTGNEPTRPASQRSGARKAERFDPRALTSPAGWRRLISSADLMKRLGFAGIAAGAVVLVFAGLALWRVGGDEGDSLRQELRNARDRQAEFLTRLADHLLQTGDRETALLLSLEAVEQTRGSAEGLAAKVALYSAWLQPRDDLILRGHGNHVSDVSFSADGCCVLSASWDETVRLWDIKSGRQVLALGQHDSPVNSAAYSPTQKRIVTAAADGKARLFDSDTSTLVHTFSGHSDDLTAVAFSPDEKQFVTASADRTAILWDVASKKSLHSFKGHKGSLEGVAFSPDGKRIATASDDQTARIYDVDTEAPILVMAGHQGAVRAVAFDPTGGYLATASEDHTARLWNAYTGKTVRIYDGHQWGVMSVAFSRDGRRLVTGAKDNTARIYDVTTGETLLIVKGHKGVVSRAAFSADGRFLVTASGDALIRLWPLVIAPDELLSEARKSAAGCLSPAQRRKYFLAEAPPAWCIEMRKPPYQTEQWRSWLKAVKAGRRPSLPADGEGS